jgi:hypothetical protein
MKRYPLISANSRSHLLPVSELCGKNKIHGLFLEGYFQQISEIADNLSLNHPCVSVKIRVLIFTPTISYKIGGNISA